MRKSYFLAAAAVVAMVGCTNEDYFGANESLKSGEAAINFGTGTKKITRADKKTGAEAAALLGDNFVVKGVKGAKNQANLGSATLVFDYYNVNYFVGTEGSTESNSSNWEYVGQSVSPFSTVNSQTIKYWDFAEDQYDFVAFSKGLNSGSIDEYFSAVDFAKIGTANAAYTVTGTLDELKECYVADLVTVYNADYTKEAVTPVFRRLQSKLRLGFYETVPGYSVKEVKFYPAATCTSTEITATPYLFTNSGETVAVGGTAEGVMEVSFPTIGYDKKYPASGDADPDYNQAHIKFTTMTGEGSANALSSNVPFGALDYADAELDEETGDYLGRSSVTASYVTNTSDAEGYYTVLPAETGKVLNLKVDYTLVAIDGSGEEINVKGATAQVPAIYTAWQPNYAYTYLFKISDQTNGYSGDYDPETGHGEGKAGLYPITFDAVVMGDVDGIVETITEVGDPSITTYQKGKVVTENDEYDAEGNIWITVDNGKTLTADCWKAGAVNVFKAEITGNKLQNITEKAVANCIETNFDPTGAATSYSVTGYIDNASPSTSETLTLTTALGAASWSLEQKIPEGEAPHGVEVSTDGTNKCIAKITAPVANTTYVFQYLKTPATYKDADFNTLATGATYYTVTSAAGVDTYTKVSAAGTETFKADTHVKKLPVVATAAEATTLTKGVVYLQKDGTKYTQFTAKGDEAFAENTYYTATFTKASGTLAKNAVYYVKQGQNVYEQRTVTAEDGLVVATTDPYYTTTDLTVVAAATTLTKGTTYYKSETSGDVTTVTTLVAKGDEAITGWMTAYTAPVFYVAGEYNTLATGAVYYTGTTATDAAPVKATADGTETKATPNDAKVVDVMPEYYYKVIRVK